MLSSKHSAEMQPFEPQLSLQDAFNGKSALSVFSNGACEATDKSKILIGGGQLVVRGMKCWYFKRDDDNDDDNKENNRIYTNITDNYRGDDVGGDGGQGIGHVAPRSIYKRTCA